MLERLVCVVRRIMNGIRGRLKAWVVGAGGMQCAYNCGMWERQSGQLPIQKAGGGKPRPGRYVRGNQVIKANARTRFRTGSRYLRCGNRTRCRRAMPAAGCRENGRVLRVRRCACVRAVRQNVYSRKVWHGEGQRRWCVVQHPVMSIQA